MVGYEALCGVVWQYLVIVLFPFDGEVMPGHTAYDDACCGAVFQIHH